MEIFASNTMDIGLISIVYKDFIKRMRKYQSTYNHLVEGPKQFSREEIKPVNKEVEKHLFSLDKD